MPEFQMTEGSGRFNTLYGDYQAPIVSCIEDVAEAWEQKAVAPLIFREQKSTHFAEGYTGTTAMDEWLPVGESGAHPQNGFTEGYPKTLYNEVFKSQFAISRELVDDNQIGTMHNKLVEELKAFSKSAKVEMQVKADSAYQMAKDRAHREKTARDAQQRKIEVEQQKRALKQLQLLKRNAVISTPPTKRLDYVEMVLSKHVPLYLEKPIATTLEDAEKIVAMAKQYDAKIIVGFAHRFRPAFVKMYDMVKSGMFGDPVNVFSYRVGAGFGYGKNNAMYGNSWRTDPKLACGMTIESVSHEFNLLTSLAGEFDTIACNVKGTISNVPQFDTNSTMVMRCKNGAVASIMTSWSSGAGANLKGYIGTNGSILLRGRNMFEFDSLTYKTVDMDHEESITFNDSYDLNKDEVIYHVHVYFQDCLKNNKPVEIGGLSEGMKVLKLSNAALESAKEQKTIALGDYYTL